MGTVRRVRKVIKFTPKRYSDLIPDWLLQKAEERKGPKPTFRFIAKEGRDGDPLLYDLEQATTNAIKEVAAHRQRKYGEDFYRQAIPETLFFMLDSFEVDAIAPAVAHWVEVQPRLPEAILDALIALGRGKDHV